MIVFRDGIAYAHMTGAEVADRARIEVALRKGEVLYRTLFETMEQGFREFHRIRGGSGRGIDHR